MCREMDALYQEGIEFGEERGKKEMVQSLFAMGIPWKRSRRLRKRASAVSGSGLQKERQQQNKFHS